MSFAVPINHWLYKKKNFGLHVYLDYEEQLKTFCLYILSQTVCIEKK